MQIYAEMIGNVMIDARSTGKYYHCKYKDTVLKYPVTCISAPHFTHIQFIVCDILQEHVYAKA